MISSNYYIIVIAIAFFKVWHWCVLTLFITGAEVGVWASESVELKRFEGAQF